MNRSRSSGPGRGKLRCFMDDLGACPSGGRDGPGALEFPYARERPILGNHPHIRAALCYGDWAIERQLLIREFLGSYIGRIETAAG